jgi:hypothetical protein
MTTIVSLARLTMKLWNTMQMDFSYRTYSIFTWKRILVDVMRSSYSKKLNNISRNYVMAKKWIQKAINPAHKGALRKELGVPEGKKIPAKKLATAAKKGGKEGKRARLAETLKKMH